MSRGAPRDAAPLTPAENELVLAVRGLAYGSVEAVVHDGRIVQIERRERVRLPSADSPSSPTRPREAAPTTRTATGQPEPRAERNPGDLP